MRSQEQAFVVVERSSRMLHTSVLKTGQDNEIILGKRVGNAGVFFHPLQRGKHLIKNGFGLRKLLWVCFSVVHSDAPVVTAFRFFLKITGNKREQVRAQRLGGPECHCFTAGCVRVGVFVPNSFMFHGGVGDGLPTGRNFQRERVNSFQVGLVKAGEQGARPIGNKQCV